MRLMKILLDFYGIGVQFSIIRDTVTNKSNENGPSLERKYIIGDRIIKVNAKDLQDLH